MVTCDDAWKKEENFIFTPFSIHLWFCYSTNTQYILFFLNLLFAISLLVGYRTKLSLFSSWWFMISLHSRNVFVLNGGDTYFRALLFWCLFLPIDEISLDRLHKNKITRIGENQKVNDYITTIPSVAYISQVNI